MAWKYYVTYFIILFLQEEQSTQEENIIQQGTNLEFGHYRCFELNYILPSDTFLWT